MPVRRLAAADFGPVHAIADASGLSVDIAAEAERTHARAWVAEDDDRVVGFLVAWDVADEVHLMDMATDPAARRVGHARALLDRLIEHARGRKACWVLLEVRRTNTPALALYRSCGFRAIGVRQSYYGPNDDAIEMMLTFDPTTGRVEDLPDEDSTTEA